MTHPGQPIATTYVEVRPTPESKAQFKKALQDYDQLTAEMGRGIGAKLDKAIGDGVRSGRLRAGQELDALDKKALNSIAASEAVGRSVGRTLVGLGKTIGAGIATSFTVGLVHTKDLQTVVSQLDAGIKNAGNTAGLTERKMLGLAKSIESYSGQSRDSVVSAEAMLVAFDRVKDSVGAGNDVFTRATKASADLAQRMGGDAASKAQYLGRALQDPIRGLSTLRQANITFNDAQVQMITHLENSGRHLEAQRAILDQVEKQVGGSARAYGQTLPGALDRAHNSFNDFSSNAIKFADDHHKLTIAVGGTVGSLYLAVKAVKAYREVRDVLYKGVAARITANLAEAKSIDAVAAAETRAAGAGVAAGGGGAAAAAGRGGLLGGLGAGVGAIGGGAVAIGAGALAVGAAGIHSIGTVKLNQRVERLQRDLEAAGATASQLHRFDLSLHDKFFGFDKDVYREGQALLQQLQQGRIAAQHLSIVGAGVVAAELRVARSTAAISAARASRLDPRTLVDTGVVGSVFGVLPDRHPNSVADARESVRAANQEIRDAQRAVNEARTGSPGASRASIAGAEASVLTARDALHRRGGNAKAEQLRLEAAEARLSDLRAKGGSNADKIRTAEDRLADARRKAGKATKDLHDAEKGTALSAKDVLDRIGGQVKNSKRLVADEGILLGKGVSSSVLIELQKLEKDAPGTLDALAKSITPAMAKSLDKQQKDLSRLNFEFLDAARVAAINDAIAANKADKDGLYAALAKSQADAWAKAQAAQQNRPTLGDPRADAAPHGPLAPATATPRSGRDEPHVVIQVPAHHARQVQHIAATAVARHDADTGRMVAGVI